MILIYKFFLKEFQKSSFEKTNLKRNNNFYFSLSYFDKNYDGFEIIFSIMLIQELFFKITVLSSKLLFGLQVGYPHGLEQVVGMGACATFVAHSIFLKLNFHYYYFSSYTLCLNIKHFCRLLQHLSHLFPTESQSKRGIEILYPNPYLILLSKHNQRIFFFFVFFPKDEFEYIYT